MFNSLPSATPCGIKTRFITVADLMVSLEEEIPKLGRILKERINNNFQLIELNPIRLAAA